jgi:DNA-binding transcriptional regulator YdaS (Cro superfamily)
MKSDVGNPNTKLLRRAALFRGIYSRVAKELGVDPSYVSRVARGQRRNSDVEAALIREVQRLDSADVDD